MSDKKKETVAPEKPDKKQSVKKAAPAPRKKKLKVYRKRSAHIIGEGFAVFLLIVVILAALSVWRLKSGPVDISFANDYIESALRDEESGVYASIDKSALYWPDLKGPLLLGLQDGRIMGADHNEIISVDEIALSLSKAKLLVGIIEPLSLIITRPSVRVIRGEDNSIDFGLGDEEAVIGDTIEEQAEGQRDLIADILDLIEKPEEGANGSSPLAALRTLQIIDAQVMVEDHKFGASWFFPDFNIVFEKAPVGLKATLDLDLPEVKDEASHFHAEVLLDREAKTAEASADFSNLDLSIFAGKIEGLDTLRRQDVVLDARLSATLGLDFTLKNVSGKISSDSGKVFSEALAPVPVVYQDFVAALAYQNGESESLRIENMQLSSNGVTFRVEGQLESAGASAEMHGPPNPEDDAGSEAEITASEAPAENEAEDNAEEEPSQTASAPLYTGSVAVSIDDMPQSNIAPLWPAALEGDASEEWIVDKMSGGDLEGLRAQTDVIVSRDDAGELDINVRNLKAFFGFVNMSMDYRNPLPALIKANGSGVFDLEKDTIAITIEQAEMGGMNISSAELMFDEVVAEGKGGVTMDIKLQGGLDKVFTYLSTEPIDLEDELDTDISKVRGETDMHVKLAFPTKDDLAIEEIQMDVTGTVRDGFMPNLIRGLPLSGGPFKVSVNNERYTVSGSGELSGRPVVFDWMEYIDSEGKSYKHRANASISIDDELREHFGVDLSDYLEGSVPAEITYTGFTDDKAEVDVSVDITPARFFIEAFDYEKASGASGSVKLTAHMRDNELHRISGLSANAPNFKMEKSAIAFRGTGEATEISRAEISRFILGETISNASVDITPSGQMKIVMDGAFLDLRPFLDKDDEAGQDRAAEPYDNPPMILSISMDQMRPADGEVIQYGKLYADIDDQGRFNQLEMDAIAGAGDIYLRYKANAQGVRTFRFEADDAGAALKAFDVYKGIRGGRLVIYGEPIRGVYDRNLIGLAEITNFRVVDAPALAQLISALSLPGLMSSLDGEGLVFSKLEANFDWLYRKKGALLVLKNGRTSGNSLGLTFDGVFDNGAGRVDVSGTIIPLSGINKAIGSIPLVGDIITGGTGALFAATYTMRGDSDNPDISVNPLSVLTPGILRRVLFE